MRCKAKQESAEYNSHGNAGKFKKICAELFGILVTQIYRTLRRKEQGMEKERETWGLGEGEKKRETWGLVEGEKKRETWNLERGRKKMETWRLGEGRRGTGGREVLRRRRYNYCRTAIIIHFYRVAVKHCYKDKGEC